MDHNKLNYYLYLNRKWLFKALLVVSVFSFSGFNPQIHPEANESIKTEITESRTRKPDYSLKKNANRYIGIRLTSPISSLKSFDLWGLLNHNILVKIKTRSYRNRLLLYSIPATKLLFKIPTSSSKDETPLYES